MKTNTHQLLNKVISYWKTTSGNAAVEFALVLPILSLLTVGVIDFGSVVYNKINLRTAVNAGVGAIMEVTTSTSSVKSLINSATSTSGLTTTVSLSCKCSDNTSISCSTKCSGGVWPDRYYQITANSNVDLIGVYGIIQNPFPLTENATMMVP